MTKELHWLWLVTVDKYWSFWTMCHLLLIANRNLVGLIYWYFFEIQETIAQHSVLSVPTIWGQWGRSPAWINYFFKLKMFKRKMPHLQLVIWRQSTNLLRDFFERECKCSRKFFSKGGEIVNVIGNYEELNI